MRLRSLHPRLLDRQGLGGTWREGLLARAVTPGQTRGYRNHPQLHRFRAPGIQGLDTYLHAIVDEADARGHNYDRTKLGPRTDAQLTVTQGQVEYEFAHLQHKLERRSVPWPSGTEVALHPMFPLTPGPIEVWEKVLVP